MGRTQTYGVIGATGKTGRRIADRLEAQGREVRRLARGTAPAFDWTEPSGWPAALAGIDRLYIAFVPDLAAAGPRRPSRDSSRWRARQVSSASCCCPVAARTAHARPSSCTCACILVPAQRMRHPDQQQAVPAGVWSRETSRVWLN